MPRKRSDPSANGLSYEQQIERGRTVVTLRLEAPDTRLVDRFAKRFGSRQKAILAAIRAFDGAPEKSTEA